MKLHVKSVVIFLSMVGFVFLLQAFVIPETHSPLYALKHTSVLPKQISTVHTINDSIELHLSDSLIHNCSYQKTVIDLKKHDTINVLLLNGHPGVENELRAVLDAVGRTIERHFNITTQYPNECGWGGMQQWYESTNFEEFQLVLVGDTTSCCHVLFQNNLHKQPDGPAILVDISNRFDYLSYSEILADLLADASKYVHRVLIVQNNLFEADYARTIVSVDIGISSYIPASGLISDAYHRIYEEYMNSNTNALRSTEPAFSVLYSVQSHNEGSCLYQELERISSDHTIGDIRLLAHRGYGGPLAMRNKTIAMVPYQVNTMSLFELLNSGAVIVIPSFSLYEKWATAQRNHSNDAVCRPAFNWGTGVGVDREFLDSDEIQYYVDWYRLDLADFFVTFDDVSDLLPESDFRKRLPAIAAAKRRILDHLMPIHVESVIAKWIAALLKLNVI